MTGFDVVRRRPVLLLWWGLFHLLYIGLTSVLAVGLAGPALTQLAALQGLHPANDPAVQAQALASMRQLLPLYGLMLPVMLVFYSMLYTAMNRAVLRPKDDRFGYLRLGRDELRQFGLFLWAIVVGVGVYIVTVVGVLILTFIGVALAALFSKGAAAPGVGHVLVAAVIVLLTVAAWIYLTVRLSLASAMTFETRKIRLLASWPLTEGRFWPMLGAYLLAACLSLVVLLLGLVVMLCICVVAAGGVDAFRFIFRPDMSALAVYLTPARILYFVLTAFLYALVWPVMLTPRAAIYRSVTAPAADPATPWGAPSLG